MIPPDDVRDEKYDAPLTPRQFAACKWMFEDRSDQGDDDVILFGATA